MTTRIGHSTAVSRFRGTASSNYHHGPPTTLTPLEHLLAVPIASEGSHYVGWLRIRQGDLGVSNNISCHVSGRSLTLVMSSVVCEPTLADSQLHEVPLSPKTPRGSQDEGVLCFQCLTSSTSMIHSEVAGRA